MNNKAKVWFAHWLWGAVASVWNGCFSTAFVTFGAAGANAAGLVDLKEITLKGFVSTLGGTILFHAVVYFNNHRLPDALPDGTTGAPETFTSAMSESVPPIPPKPPSP